MSDLKTQLLKLGSTNPELRPHLRPLLDTLKVGGRPGGRNKYDAASAKRSDANIGKIGKSTATEMRKSGFKKVTLTFTGGYEFDDSSQKTVRMSISADVSADLVLDFDLKWLDWDTTDKLEAKVSFSTRQGVPVHTSDLVLQFLSANRTAKALVEWVLQEIEVVSK